jgi:hypothetical protein
MMNRYDMIERWMYGWKDRLMDEYFDRLMDEYIYCSIISIYYLYIFIDNNYYHEYLA